MATEYVIWVNGVHVPVTEVVYHAFKRAEWSEERRYRYRVAVELSLEVFQESGVEFSTGEKPVAEVVEENMLLDMLQAALQALDTEEYALIHALFFEEKTEREVACIMGLPRATVHHRKNCILKKLKNIFD